MLIAFVWSLFTSIGVYHLLSRDEAARLDRLSRGELAAAVAMPDPAFAAVVTLFVSLSAPYFLARSLGAKGLAQGIGLLVVSVAGAAATSIGLSMVHR
jgi:protein-S-isoprenylcysteine O-methyltransferase Ste14